MANIKKDIRIRVYIAFLGMCVFGIAILWKAIALQLVSGKMLLEKSKKDYTRISNLEPERGNIYTEDGSLLSITIPEFDIHIDFGAIHKDTFANNVKPLAQQLGKLFGDKSANAYEQELRAQFKAKTRYYLLKKNVRYNEYMAMRSFEIFKHGGNKGGFIAQDHIKRINPFGLLANRTIGIYRSNAQCVGLEGQYNSFLQGREGKRLERKIAGGTWMPIDGSEIESKNGQDIVTTIDVNTQDIAENALLKVLTKEEAAYGTCIVMETKTGKIKALVNLGRQGDGSYWEDYNYAIRPIEPGSTFKINDLMSAIDDGYVTIDDKINAQNGTAYFGNQRMSDSHLGLGTISIKEAFAHSSNVACAKLIYNNYLNHPGDYIKHLKKMHIDLPTGIDLAGEISPSFSSKSLSFTNKASLAWMAIGYEVKVSPLRTAMVYNTIANNGIMMKPYIVSEIKEYGQLVQQFAPTVVAKNVCKPSTIAQLKEAAYSVVQEGTGKALKNNVYTICGKTGTAQVADKGIRYKDRVYHGSFVGFFPKDDPMYTICVVVRTKKGANTYYGGQIALPVFKEVADRLYATNYKQHAPLQAKDTTTPINLAIKTTSNTKLNTINNYIKAFNGSLGSKGWCSAVHTDSAGYIKATPLLTAINIVPDVMGMGLRDAIYLLENAGLRVQVSGKGKVTAQSKLPGEQYTKGQIITLQLI
jgi:cell division protein FtsI (penicillin-binding protein 3)